ncbi:MAG: AAA family ATPase [Collinsella sp.]
MLILTTYRRNQFARLKDRLKSEGYDYTSALSLTSTAQIAQQARERSIAVDISSLISLPDSSGGKAGIVATFEALLYQMPKNTVFVADETAANKYAYEMRTIFDTVQPCDIDNNSEDQAVLSKENPKRLIDLDDPETKALLDQFACDLIGQDQFKGEFRKQVEIFRLFNSIGEQPILSLFLIGPSGVGKTETARILSKLLAPGEPLPKVNFGNYSSKDSLNSLIGSPRGYMGSEEGELTMKIERSNSGVILIDEFEKGDSAVWSFFLDLLENGKFTDSQGGEHDLNGYTIVFTSNTPRTEVQGKFPPELLSRFNLKVNFKPVNDKEKKTFVSRYITSVAEKYRSSIDESVENPDVIAERALQDIDTANEENIRVLKNTARKWFAGYIAERSKANR